MMVVLFSKEHQIMVVVYFQVTLDYCDDCLFSNNFILLWFNVMVAYFQMTSDDGRLFSNDFMLW